MRTPFPEDSGHPPPRLQALAPPRDPVPEAGRPTERSDREFFVISGSTITACEVAVKWIETPK